MCGIVGFCNRAGTWESDIKAMNSRMKHRGPDDEGIWTSDNNQIVIGHRRLAVVDLSTMGAQPMISHSGRYIMAYNGEIYGYKELAKALIAEGYVDRFRGDSDSEVLLEAIEAYGIELAISKVKGMFALSIYDTESGTIRLARDRIGEKPLYYGFVGDSFVYASDISSISVLQGFNNDVDTGVLGIYMLHGYIPAPYSIYRNIYKLEPGKILSINAPYREEDIAIGEYWSIKDVAVRGQNNLFKGSYEEAVDEVERLLRASIAGQMEADVPVGAFLSAGIDSSTVVAIMQSLSNDKIKSFTIGMEEEGYNEAIYAHDIAKHIGTCHTELYINSDDMLSVIPKLSYIFGEPYADSSAIPTYLVSKMTREHVTVSLSGDGGDELFSGYNTYRSVSRIWSKIGKIPHPIRKATSGILLNIPILNSSDKYRTIGRLVKAENPANLYELYGGMNVDISSIILDKKIKEYAYTLYDGDILDEINHKIMLMDMLMYHPDDILVKVDRTGMAVSLESRIPMLDRDFVEFAWRMPIEYKWRDGVGKSVLRDVLYRYVPKELFDRPKKGFSIPIDRWLRAGELREWAESLLDRELIRQQGFFEEEAVWKLWRDFIDNGIWRVQIWYILMFQQWLMEVK